MNIEELKGKFRKYVEKYDISIKQIILKYYHSIRVMDFYMFIAKDNNFSDKDVQIALLIGLLHDYARFEQWQKYQTYSDIKSIDHGDLAVEKLFDNNEIEDYCKDKEYYEEIYNAIKYHNKYNYPDNIDEHSKLMCKIIRDADKLDIFYLLGINEILMKEDNEDISYEIKQDFYSNKSIYRTHVKNKSDEVILKLAMVFDLNFKYSLNIN